MIRREVLPARRLPRLLVSTVSAIAISVALMAAANAWARAYGTRYEIRVETRYPVPSLCERIDGVWTRCP